MPGQADDQLKGSEIRRRSRLIREADFNAAAFGLNETLDWSCEPPVAATKVRYSAAEERMTGTAGLRGLAAVVLSFCMSAPHFSITRRKTLGIEHAADTLVLFSILAPQAFVFHRIIRNTGAKG